MQACPHPAHLPAQRPRTNHIAYAEINQSSSTPSIDNNATNITAAGTSQHLANGSTSTHDHTGSSSSTTSSSDQPLLRGARVSIEEAVKYYNTRQGVFKALNGVTLDIAPGTITALLGPSGSGKTTLLRVIAGLEDPTTGKIFFDGEEVTNVSIQDRDIGVVFQGYALFKHMNVSKNISFGPRIRNADVDIEKKVEELLKLIELEEYADRYPGQLSGGQKQRVALARALACNPRVLLLDEPFGALDPVVRKSLRAGLGAIVRRLGVTTIMVTHDQVKKSKEASVCLLLCIFGYARQFE